MEQLTAEVMAVRWSGDDFAVLAAITDDGEEVTLTGPLAHVHDGELLEVGGSWREHPKHGRQFSVERVRIAAPASEDALLAYLASVKHVGPMGAAWLLERHGASVLEAIDRDPGGRLSEVPGIGRRRLPEAVSSWERRGGERAIRLFLDEHGVPAAAASRLIRTLGASAIEQLRSDPYAATDVEGIGFATADALARALGIAADDPARLDAGIVHALRAAEDDGHCHLPRAELETRAARLLGAEVGDRVGLLGASGRLVLDGGRIVDPAIDALERRLAGRVTELLDAPAHLSEPTGRDEALTAEQWDAVRLACTHRLSILTGGPGTGKSWTMRALVEAVVGDGKRVRLCAPTGKAARRLGEATGHDATTIHRLLEWSGEEGGFTRDESDPIPGADLLVVDEASMLSLRLADALFRAVGPRTHVLLVGDADQLPPVGAGRVLDDLLDSGDVPAVRLTEIFRQARRSLIVRAAHAINHGERPPTVPAGPDDLRDFFVIERDSAAELHAEAVSLATQRLPAHYELEPARDVQVLSPMHRGAVGIEALNTELRARLNAEGEPIPGTSLRVGDRVVQSVNDHERELMNGETGVLVDVDRERSRATLAADDGRRITLPVDALSTIRLAYCMSVHKAQGSSAPAVIVVLDASHHVMLTRNLLYTAVTRAERVCVLVCQPRALDVALRAVQGRARFTRLAELVRA
ncbi:MAG: exodeoxyribonuclease alpha subunit [Solirubrobacteraceae bacterium]|nr:exodeoxyribonuclease alpha subunit [Solirubrobacteraceae bacterium]